MWFFSSRKARPGTPDRPRHGSYRPRLEALEDRSLLSAGALDPTFGSGGIVTTALNKYNDQAYGALLQPNGNVIAYGDAQTSGGGSYIDNFGLARYTPPGTLDTTFGSRGVVITSFPMYTIQKVKYVGSDYVQAAALQSDGKIVAAGRERDLVRYNSNGTLDTTFGSGGVAIYPMRLSGIGPSNWYSTNAVLIEPNGDIVVGGTIIGSDGQQGALLRYTPSGTLDPTFGSGGEVVVPESGVQGSTRYIEALALENGELVAGGRDTVGTLPHPQPQPWALFRYTLDGTLDTSFGSGGVVSIQPGTDNVLKSLLVQPDGRIVAVGSAVNSASQRIWALARFNVDGSLDSSFGSGGITTSNITGNDWAQGSALQPNGQIVVTGTGSLNSTNVLEVGVYNPDGSPDTFFGSGGFVTQAVGSSARGMGVVVQADGKIVAAGIATVGGKDDFLLARYGPSAAQIGSFTASPNPVTAGSSETLTASNITLADPSSTITQVAFYVQLNGTNTLLGSGTQTRPGVWTFTFTVNLAPGSYTLFAQAQDSDGVFGDPLALTLRVM
jgi:uncharacterized delta-60 repeat protein